jgi:hypothetical protein
LDFSILPGEVRFFRETVFHMFAYACTRGAV